MKKIMTIMAMAGFFLFNSCAAKNNENLKETKSGSTVLVAYFSAQGHTKALAEKISEVTAGELFEIVPEQPYTEDDLDGWNDSARGTCESKDRTTRPKVKSHVENFEKYDTIYLGFPIWWYTAPTIVNTFLEGYDTAGKVIIPFATSGGSEIGDTEKDLRVSASKAVFKPGKVMNNYGKEEVAEWINTNK